MIVTHGWTHTTMLQYISHEFNLFKDILVEVRAVCRGSAPASTLPQACITTGMCGWDSDCFLWKGVSSMRLVEQDAL